MLSKIDDNGCIVPTGQAWTSQIRQYIEKLSSQHQIFGWAVQAGHSEQSNRENMSDSKYTKLWMKLLQDEKSVVVVSKGGWKFYMIPVDIRNEKWCSSYVDMNFPYGSYLVLYINWNKKVKVSKNEEAREDESNITEQDLLFNSLVQSVEQSNNNPWLGTGNPTNSQQQDLVKQIKDALRQIENISERIKKLHPVTSRKFEKILKSIMDKDN